MFKRSILKALPVLTAAAVTAGVAGWTFTSAFAAEQGPAQDHGAVVSRIAKAAVTGSSNATNRGEQVRVVAQSDLGKGTAVAAQAAQTASGPASLNQEDKTSAGHERPRNHGFFVSQVARGLLTAVQGVVFPASAKNHGERVRAVAQSDIGKTTGK